MLILIPFVNRQGPTQDKVKEYLAPMYESRRTPPYLANVAPDAEVRAFTELLRVLLVCSCYHPRCVATRTLHV